MTITRAAIYLRQSKDVDGDELAVDRQRTECLKLIEPKGWTPVEYKDDNVSASNGKHRPEYERMLRDIEAGTIGAVVVWDLDRLHRRPIELEHFIALADDKRIALATVTGEIDLGTHNGRLYARIKGAVARAEMDQKSARQKLAAKQLAASGTNWWSARPFGYVVRVPVLDENGQPMLTAKRKPVYAPPTLDPIESEAVRKAYSSLLAGSSLRSIAKDLDAAGLRTPRGNRWVTSSQVRQLLESERNAGLRVHDGELIEANWPKIVERDIWEGAVAILSDESRLCGTSRARKHLLSNLLFCGGMVDAKGKATTDPAKIVKPCGSKMGSGISGRGKTIYVCRACNGVSRDGASLDDLVSERVTQRLAMPDAIELTRPEKRGDQAELRVQRRALQARLESLGIEFADSDPSAWPVLKAATKRITEKLAVIEQTLLSAQTVNVFNGVIGADDVRGAFLSLDLDRRRAIIAELYTITVLPTVRGARFRPEDVDIEPADTPM